MQKPGEDGKAHPYAITRLSDLPEIPPTSWAIDNFLPVNGCVLLYGPGNTGKTFLALDWSLRLGMGWDWFGIPVKQSRVLYAYGEGWSDLPVRVQAWKEGNHVDTLPEDSVAFIGVEEPIPSLRWSPEKGMPPSIERLLETVNKFQPDFLVLDPIQELFAGLDNNSDREVQKVFELRSLLRQMGCGVIFIHHMRKDGDTYRGATTWRDLADVGLALTAPQDEEPTILRLRMDRNRFGPKAREYELTLQAVQMTEEGPSQGLTSMYLASSLLHSAAGVTGKVWMIVTTLHQALMPISYKNITDSMGGASSHAAPHLKRLVTAGLLTKAEGSRQPYELTPLGLRAIDDRTVLEGALETERESRQQYTRDKRMDLTRSMEDRNE